MAADIFPTKKPASTTTVQQYQQQNLNNNNTIQNCNWQGLYSTIRERYVRSSEPLLWIPHPQFNYILNAKFMIRTFISCKNVL